MPVAGLAVQLLLGLLDRASSITALIQQAQASGKDITQAQLDALVADDDKARKALADAIAAARAGG